MDPKSTADEHSPPIPTRHHFHLPSRDNRTSRHRDSTQPKAGTFPPANPEVISNLITSLDAISQPANSHFESQPSVNTFPFPAVPASKPGYTSPSSGSFGVDYGAYARRPGPDKSVESDPLSLDNLAASAPIIRTSKPTSGYSPLASPQSPPHNRSSSRESGLRSFLRGSGIGGSDSPSRPSSPGSLNSKNDDAQSIGNLSIERGSAQTPELRHRRSHDSWSRKASRTSKGLMYMSSKERLRDKDKETDRSRAPIGAASTAHPGSITHHAGRTESLLAETPIREEPHTTFDDLILNEPTMTTPKAIPARDSSLRKSASSTKRSSARRSKRESDAQAKDAILEAEEHEQESDLPLRNHNRRTSERATANTSFLYGPDETPTQPLSPSKAAWLHAETNIGNIDFDDDAAPFPVAAQARRHDPSGRLSPAPKDISRSSSRLKRLSGPLSPRSDSRTGAASPEPTQSANNFPAGYERPESADSIDDAVESYLCSPRLSQKIRHPQTGRVISFSEVGDANGSAVFCCVGMGLTRYITAFYDELALTLKLRLITPDRPGVGGSEPYTDGSTTPLSWPDDVYAICQALKITKFSILAHSAGAIYALATALRMPQHIRGRIHLLAPWIPPSQMNVFGGTQTSPPTHAIPTSQKILRALPTPFLKAANSSFMSATSSSITSSLPKNPRKTKRKSNANGKDSNTTPASRNVTPMGLDQDHHVNATPSKGERAGADESPAGLTSPSATENMDQIQPSGSGIGGNVGNTNIAADSTADKERQTTYDLRLTHAIWELATTGANPAVDLLVCLERRHTIGFRYVDITRPVVIHHGSRDTRVPVENVKWLGKTMRRCEVRVLEGEGHGLMASATVMGSVLMEMSKEWEDWMRVTGADGRKDHDRGRRVTLGV